MNVFDQAARFAVKADPAGFFRWLLPGLPPGLGFRGWLDARTLGFPGEPDRVCDTVAEFFDPAEPTTRWALATEFQTQPDRDILDRLLEYLARLRRELRHGPRRGERYQVAAALVHLTGRPADASLEMTLPSEPPIGLRLTIASRALRDESAATTLAEIDAGRLARAILPWVPLMKDGGKPTIMKEWRRLARREPDRRTRANLATLALVFADLTGDRSLWKQALEGWSMRESTFVNEWTAEATARARALALVEGRIAGKAEGKAEGEREALVRLLRLRFSARVPRTLMATIEAETDLARLAGWFEAAVKADSLKAFRALAKI